MNPRAITMRPHPLPVVAREVRALPDFLTISWPLPSAREIDLWLWDTATLNEQHARLEQYLAPDELRRRDRFVHDRDQIRFTRCRGLLRHVLGGYLGVSPTGLTIGQTAYGKPMLNENTRDGVLHFNLSHSGTWLALACSTCGPVGVDIELYDTTTPVLDIAARFFHRDELTRLHQLQPDAQRDLFYRWWTAKEALLKAQGIGLMDGLDQINLSGWTDQVTLDAGSAVESGWRLGRLDLPPGLTGTWVGGPDVGRVRIRQAARSP